MLLADPRNLENFTPPTHTHRLTQETGGPWSAECTREHDNMPLSSLYGVKDQPESEEASRRVCVCIP